MAYIQSEPSPKQYYLCDVATGTRDRKTGDPAGFDQVLDLIEYDSAAQTVNVFKGAKGQGGKITFADKPAVYKYNTNAARKDFGSRLDLDLDGKWEYGFFSTGQYSPFSPALSFDVVLEKNIKIGMALNDDIGMADINGDGLPDVFRGTTNGKGILSIHDIGKKPASVIQAENGKPGFILFQ